MKRYSDASLNIKIGLKIDPNNATLLSIKQKVEDLKKQILLWDTSTPHADKFAIKGNTITMISDGCYVVLLCAVA